MKKQSQFTRQLVKALAENQSNVLIRFVGKKKTFSTLYEAFKAYAQLPNVGNVAKVEKVEKVTDSDCIDLRQTLKVSPNAGISEDSKKFGKITQIGNFYTCKNVTIEFVRKDTKEVLFSVNLETLGNISIKQPHKAFSFFAEKATKETLLILGNKEIFSIVPFIAEIEAQKAQIAQERKQKEMAKVVRRQNQKGKTLQMGNGFANLKDLLAQ